MKVGIDANSLSYPKRTGIGRYTVGVLDQLFIIAPDNEYYLYAAQPIDPKIKQDWSKYNNVIYREGNFPSRYIWQQLFLGRWLKRDNPDVYLALDGLLPLGCSIPSVTIVHDLIWLHYPESTAPHVRWVYRLRLKSSARKARHCIAVSETTRADLLKYTGLEPSKVTVAYNGVETKFKPQGEEKINQVLEVHKIRRPYIFFIGNLMKHKNLVSLIKAYKIFINEINDKEIPVPQLVIAGCRNWRSSTIFETVRTLKLENYVNFLGYVTDSELMVLYSGAEFFVFPSLIEGFGLPILEAQACGTPVVCSNTYSLPEVGGDSVIYFDPYDVEDMATKMLEVYEDKKLQEKLRRKGFENIKRFSWQKTASQILSVLEEIAV